MPGQIKKPYRRYRARGGNGGGSPGDGLAALRELNRGGAVATPPPFERKRLPDHRRIKSQRRALTRHDKRWWSLRGLSWKGWTWRVAVLVLLAVLIWGGLGYLALRNAAGDANARIAPRAKRVLANPHGGLLGTPENTLILGSDARRGETRSRADTILIMRTDPDSGHIKYLSIPRDLEVQIPHHGTQKINAAFAFYGQAGMIRAVNRVTGLPIHHLVVINFRGLPKLVDDLGGVTVKNPTRLVRCPYPGGTTVSFPRGKIHLDGARALEFARVRKCDGDFERIARQQALVAALKGQVLSLGSLPEAPWRGAAVVRAISTDLGAIDLMKLGWLQARLKSDPKDRLVIPGRDELIGGVSYVVEDLGRAKQVVDRFVAK